MEAAPHRAPTSPLRGSPGRQRDAFPTSTFRKRKAEDLSPKGMCGGPTLLHTCPAPDHPQARLQVPRLRTWPQTFARLLCARAHRPLAHDAAHSHAQGTRVASTASTRQRPRVGSGSPNARSTTRGAPLRPSPNGETLLSSPEGEERTPTPQGGVAGL